MSGSINVRFDLNDAKALMGHVTDFIGSTANAMHMNISEFRANTPAGMGHGVGANPNTTFAAVTPSNGQIR